jgi:hypothetical protein
LLFEKKDALEAVMGVLGVLLLERFGGGVVFRSSLSAEGTENDDILLLNGVPRGKRFKGGSLIGCRFFLLVCGTDGDVSTSVDPEPTVSPLLCLIVDLGVGSMPGLLLSTPESSTFDSSLLSTAAVSLRSCVEVARAEGFVGGIANEKPLCSESLGDSYAFGIAGTGGTSSSSPAVEPWSFLALGVGRRDPDKVELRGWSEEVASFNELRLEFEDNEIPDA